MRTLILFSSVLLSAVTLLSACSQTAPRTPPETVEPAPAVQDAIKPQPVEQEAPTQPVRDELSMAPKMEEAQRSQAQPMERRRMMPAPAPASAGMALYAPPPPPVFAQPENREKYASIDRNAVQRVAENPVSTFSVDVDTGSYANVRRYLTQGQLPPRDAVRVEEFINNFDYGYAAPRERGQPFAVLTEIVPTPWNAKTHLLRVGIQGWKPQTRPVGTNLVFLVDVSGSMLDADKLPLVKTALKMLLEDLSARDRISLVVYAGASGVVLEPTPGDQRQHIAAALDRLEAGGSTNGGAGIQLAYAMARQGWIEGGVNRVLLATDGDFNVGTTRFETLLDLVREQRRSGIALTTLGFGQGNYNDHLMEQLANVGDGNHAYIDSAQEAHKVLVRQREATLTTIARDVKIQIEFNPDAVAEYRLIGYENRALAREDFANDAVDAGEIGAGHTVTALYEIALAGSGGEKIPALRYGAESAADSRTQELAHLRLRYKRPEDGADAASRLIERALSRREILQRPEQMSDSLRLAAAVAAFGQRLAGDVNLGAFDYTRIEQLAAAVGDDPYGDRAGFRQLLRTAQALSVQAGVDAVTPIGG